MQVVWLLLDVVIGVVIAGIVAPLAIMAMPSQAQGPSVLLAIGVACVVFVSIFRRTVVGTPGDRHR